ncbi:hypothetical protein [Acinetobacter ursingii]|uniref:hypothetical protein n=1 Tax=Acinetobacter ursingii TaxID=108980 RepID=UPI003009DE36
MDNVFVILIVIIIAVIFGILLQGRKPKYKKNSNFKDIVKKTFPKYVIREKNNQIMICEYNHRNEPDELIFIRIGQRKSIEKMGRRIIATYPNEPNARELKQDLNQYLK